MGPNRAVRQASGFRATSPDVRPGTPLVVLFVWLALCSACSSHGSRGGGSHEYVRCMAVDEPDAREGRVGSVRFVSDERALRFSGLPDPLRVAAFRGAGTAAPGLAEAVLGVAEQRASLVFVLGGLGDDEATVRAHLTALGALRVPTIVIPGGDDVAEAFGEAFDDDVPANVFDGRRYRRVEAGRSDFLLLAGAPEGRYAASTEHCGNDDDDRDELEARDGVRTILVSWAAPSGGGRFAVGRGFDGVDSGDRAVADLLGELGQAGGLFAYPATRASLPTVADGQRALGAGEADRTLRLVVPRIAGPTDEHDDFGLVTNGAAVIELTASGTSFVGVSASEGG